MKDLMDYLEEEDELQTQMKRKELKN